MDIPDIPDNRPHKVSSETSYAPTIVLDEAAQFEPDTQTKHLSRQSTALPNEIEDIEPPNSINGGQW